MSILDAKNRAEMTDQELVALALAGDDKSFDFLIKRYLKLVYSVTSQYIEDRDEKEDIIQEIFVKIWKNLKKYDPNKKISNWIWEISKNTSLDYLKKKKAIAFSDYEFMFGKKIEDQFADHNQSQIKIIENKEMASHLAVAMASLDSTAQKAIAWRHKKELSFKEISSQENKPINTVKSQYRRAIQKLKKLI